MVFKSDRQRKAVMAKLKGRTRSNIQPEFYRIVTPIGDKKVLKRRGVGRVLALDEFKSREKAQSVARKLRKKPFSLPIAVEKGRV